MQDALFKSLGKKINSRFGVIKINEVVPYVIYIELLFTYKVETNNCNFNHFVPICKFCVIFRTMRYFEILLFTYMKFGMKRL